MNKLSLVLASGAIFTAACSAQSPSSTTAAHIFYGASLPANCRTSTGDIFFKTTATIQPYYCSATNTWTVMGSSGGGSVINPSSYTVTAQTQVTLSATGTSVNVSPTTAHGMGVYAKPSCFNSASPKRAYDCDYTQDASGNIVIDFFPAFTGTIQVGPGGGFVPGSGNPAGSGSELQYRSSASVFGAVTGSSVSGGVVTLAGNLLFTDATYDIGASGATRPRDFFLSRNAVMGGSSTATNFVSTIATGTAPFTVASTTVVANLNASALGGATFAAPGAIGGGTPAAITGTTITGAAYATTTNCSDSAGAAACGSAAAGAVVIDAAATTTVVSTTAVTANSEITLAFDASLGTRLSVTCNTVNSLPYVSARTAGTSFTIKTDVAPITNPACVTFKIVN